MIKNQYMLVSGHFLIPENIIILTLFTSIKSLSLGMKLLELTYKLTLFLIGNDMSYDFFPDIRILSNLKCKVHCPELAQTDLHHLHS